MPGSMKSNDVEAFRKALEALRSRLRGDLNQMADEALNRSQGDASGGLSSLPLHMADVGTENYEQEFTLSLIENEQETLEQVHEAIARVDAGTFGICAECGEPIARPRLQALPYTRHCIECARKLENVG